MKLLLTSFHHDTHFSGRTLQWSPRTPDRLPSRGSPVFSRPESSSHLQSPRTVGMSGRWRVGMLTRMVGQSMAQP